MCLANTSDYYKRLEDMTTLVSFSNPVTVAETSLNNDAASSTPKASTLPGSTSGSSTPLSDRWASLL